MTGFLRLGYRPAQPRPAAKLTPTQFTHSTGIVCFFKDEIVGVLPLDSAVGEDGVDEDAVEAWLQRRRCLVGLGAPAGAAAARELADPAAAGSSEDDDEDDGNSLQAPCEECGRRYPHQHIRSVYRAADADSDSDDGD